MTAGETDRALLDDATVVYAPSARTAAVAAARSAQRHGLSSLYVGVQPPESDPDQPAFARDEIALASSFFHGNVRAVQAASVPELEETTREAQTVHFACHASFDPLAPRSSSLELGSGTTLTVKDIVQARIAPNAAVVILSACQTALTDLDKLPNEAIGIGPAFIEAGAAGVIATQWRVSSLVTALIMAKLAEFMQMPSSSPERPGTRPATALRRAQNWLRRSTSGEIRAWLEQLDPACRDREVLKAIRDFLPPDDPAWIPFAEPYYWAGFVYIGGIS